MKINIKEIAIFGMLGAVMYASKVVMEIFPNIHLLGVFTIAITVVYRKKALYAIYTYVILNGIFSGFALWWIPYTYIWTVLWACAMAVPKQMPSKLKPIVYMIINALHGFLFGTLYAPAQALIFGLDIKSTVTWIVAGLPWDFVHGISNLVCGILIVPVILVLKRAERFAASK